MTLYLHFEVNISCVPVVDADVAILSASQQEGSVPSASAGALGGHVALHHLPNFALRSHVHNVFIHQQIVAHLWTPTMAQSGTY